MHCYFDNLITIAKCFCKALRILQSNAQVWGAGPSSVFCSSVGVLCTPQAQHRLSGLLPELKKNARTCSNSTLFWRQRLGCLSRLLALTTHQRSLFADEGEIGEKRKEGKKKKRQQKTTLLQTRWEHSTWPNQSITSVGRRCSTAVEQHTISQSIGHKHMVTNQWHPEDLGGLSRALLVHAWWLHNHTSFHSLEDTNQHSNNLPWNPPRRAY